MWLGLCASLSLLSFQNCGLSFNKFEAEKRSGESSSIFASSTALVSPLVVKAPETTSVTSSAQTVVVPAPASAPALVLPSGYFLGVNFEGVEAGEGHIGVDISWPQGGTIYNPCHEHGGVNDPYYGACAMADSSVNKSSYYKVQHFQNGTNDFPFGIFVDFANWNLCYGQAWCPTTGQIVTHGWSGLVSDVALEIYPASSSYGGLRANVNSFPFAVNGGSFSPSLGKISLPKEEGPTVKLNGFISFDGSYVDSKRTEIAFFQETEPTTSSTGYPFYSFSATHANDDGYYSSGVVLPGLYKVYITDKAFGKTVIIHTEIRTRGDRLDFDLSKGCFGFSSCE